MNNSDQVTYKDITDAAAKLSYAVSTGYQLEAMNIWTYDSIDSFIEKYTDYAKIQANRGYGIPFDLSADAYMAIKSELDSLYTFTTFMQEYFIPYFNVMSDYSNLTSQSSIDFFNDSICADIGGTSVTLDQTIYYLSDFSDIDKPCTDLSEGVIESFNALVAFSNWTPSNKWRITLSDVLEKLAPATASSDLESINEETVTYNDLVTAANNLVTRAASDDLDNIIGDWLFDKDSRSLMDFKTDNCNIDKEPPFVQGVQYVIFEIVGWLNANFTPYYELILNNQDLVSEESLEWWNYNFNAAIHGGSSIISIFNSMNQFLYMSIDGCPNIEKDTPFWDQFDTFLDLFSEGGGGFNLIVSDAYYKLQPSNSQSDNSLEDASPDIVTQANDLSLKAKDSSLQPLNSFAGLGINDFVYYFNLGVNSIAGYAIADILDGLLALAEFAKDYVLPLNTSITNNPEEITQDSLNWWNDNFTAANLKGSDSVSMSIIDALERVGVFAITGDVSSIKEGDDTWNMLLVLYYFTPWNSSNSIYQLMVSAADNIKSS